MSSFFNPGRTPSRPPSLITISGGSDSSESWISSPPHEAIDHDDQRVYVHDDDNTNNSTNTTTVLNRNHSNNSSHEAQPNQRPDSENSNRGASNDRDHHQTEKTRITTHNSHQTNTHLSPTSQSPPPPHKTPAKSSNTTPVSAQQDETRRRRRAQLRDRYYRTNSLLNEYRIWILDYPVEISVLEEVLSKLKGGLDGCKGEDEVDDGSQNKRENGKFDASERRIGVNNAGPLGTNVLTGEEKSGGYTTKDDEISSFSHRGDQGMASSTLTSIQRVERAIDRLREDLDLATLTVPILEDMRDKLVPEMGSRGKSSGGSCGSPGAGSEHEDVDRDEDGFSG